MADLKQSMSFVVHFFACNDGTCQTRTRSLHLDDFPLRNPHSKDDWVVRDSYFVHEVTVAVSIGQSIIDRL